MSNGIVRSVCYFTDIPDHKTVGKVNNLATKITEHGYDVQTKRICSPFEDTQRIAQILRLVQGLSNKHKKPLSVRLVSDGKAKIGEKKQISKINI